MEQVVEEPKSRMYLSLQTVKPRRTKSSNSRCGYLKDILLDFLKNGRDWETRRTSVLGIFVVKASATRNNPPRLLVQMNPLDEAGRLVKKRGLVIRSRGELEQFKTLLQNERLQALIAVLEELSGSGKDQVPREGGALEI